LDVKKRFSEEQIIGFLREADKGMAVKELCRNHGFSEASYYLWRGKFGGMDVSDARRLKTLEAENTKLKKLLAEAMLEKEVIQEALRKNCDRTGPSGGGAVDTDEGTVAATGTGDCRHERKLAAV
jgi:putative transposase